MLPETHLSGGKWNRQFAGEFLESARTPRRGFSPRKRRADLGRFWGDWVRQRQARLMAIAADWAEVSSTLGFYPFPGEIAEVFTSMSRTRSSRVCDMKVTGRGFSFFVA